VVKNCCFHGVARTPVSPGKRALYRALDTEFYRHAFNQENRKEDAGDGGARRLQARADQGCVLLQLALTTAFWLIDRRNLVAVLLFALSG
jgi:hypothetical protein